MFCDGDGSRKKNVQEYRKPVFAALVQWFLTTIFQVDRLFFTYDAETSYFIIAKLLYLAALIAAWCFGFHVHKKIIEKDPGYLRGFQVFTVYFTILMVLLLIFWPGTWSWDDLFSLDSIKGYQSFNAWQHIITGIYQDVFLQILPFPGGIILLQNLVIAICSAYSVTRLERAFQIRRFRYALPDILLKILPFLLPPVLLYQFSGFQMGFYVHLELTMLVILVTGYLEGENWGWGSVLLLCFLTVIVSTWRTESLFYVPCVCIFVLAAKKQAFSTIMKTVCIVLLVLGFLGMKQWQNAELGNGDYQIVSLLRPCVEVVRAADRDKDSEELDTLDKVIDLEIVYSHPDDNGEALYWNTKVIREQYTDQDYEDFTKAFLRLSMKYPGVVLLERWKLFLKSTGITGDTKSTIVEGSANMFDENSTSRAVAAVRENHWLVNTPVLKEFRKHFIFMLGGYTPGGAAVDLARRTIWNSVVPIGILICAWIMLLIRKQWYLWLVCSAVVLRIPVVILTEPSNMFMYHLSFYFLGYMFLIYYLLIFVSRKPGRRIPDTEGENSYYSLNSIISRYKRVQEYKKGRNKKEKEDKE